MSFYWPGLSDIEDGDIGMTEDETMRKYAEAHGIEENNHTCYLCGDAAYIRKYIDGTIRFLCDKCNNERELEIKAHVCPAYGLEGEFVLCGERYKEEKGLGVCPLPCVRDEHGEIKNQTVKDLVEKIDSELTELKWELASYPSNYVAFYYAEIFRSIEWVRIADEAADTVTAITTLLEALGIDADARNEAQRRVNEKNRRRGRL